MNGAGQPHDLPTREQRLDEVLTVYLKAVDAGQTPDRRQWLDRHPDLAGELKTFLTDEARLDRLAAPLRALVSASRISLGRLGVPPAGDASAGEFQVVHLGDYELLEEIGRGGMGVVYRARQRGLDRIVAVKMIRPGAYVGPEALARFRAEARAAARLQHPNVVQVFEVGSEAGHSYLAMEHVAGGSLADLLDGTPLPAAPAAGFLETVARAVHAAHQCGIIHRDLKPANILLSRKRLDGAAPKVTDFGLAKQLDEDPAHQTETGVIVGTASYMAPEQAEGKNREVSPATDVYALGVILYELLTGRPPFKGSNRLETLWQVASEQPVPPRRLVPAVPRDLETITLKCLQKDPKRRYATAEALADDLRRFLDGKPILARPAGSVERLWRWCRRNPALAAVTAGLALALTVGLALTTWQWQRAEGQRQRAEDGWAEAEKQKGEAEDQKAQAQKNLQDALHEKKKADEAFDLVLHKALKDFTVGSEQGLAKGPALQRLRKDLLEGCLDYYQDFLRRHENDPAPRAETADVHVHVGEITSAVGRKEDALAAYQKAQAAYRELLRAEPDNASHRENLANATNSIGILQDTLGRRKDALASYEEARGLFEEALRARPGDTGLRRGLAHIHNNLGALLASTGRLDRGLEEFTAARTMREELVGDLGDPESKRQLASVCENVGVLLGRIGREEDALTSFHEARVLREEIFARSTLKSDAQFLRELARSYHFIGQHERLAGNPGKARETFQKGLDVLGPLAKDNPSVTQYQEDLAAAHVQLGLAHRDAGDPGKALGSFRTAREIQDRLVRDHPGVPWLQSQLATTYFHIGYVHSTRKEREEQEEALWAYRQAQALREKVVQADPDDPEHHHDFGSTLNNLGLVLMRLDRFDDALATLRWAIAEQRVAFDRLPQVPRYRESLANHYGALAEVLRAVGKPADAVAATLERQKLVAGKPKELYNAAAEITLAAALVGKGKEQLNDTERDQRRRYAGLALEALRQARDCKFSDLEQLKTDPRLQLLREDERWDRFLAEFMVNAPP